MAKTHRKTCLHCEFVKAVKRKYPDWAKVGAKPHKQDEEVRLDMLMSWVKIGSQMLRGMQEEDQKRYLAMVAYSAGGFDKMIADLVESAGATKQ